MSLTFALVGNQSNVAAKADKRIGSQVFLQRLFGQRHIMGADYRSTQFACHQRLCGRRGIALLGVIDVVGIADVALSGNGQDLWLVLGYGLLAPCEYHRAHDSEGTPNFLIQRYFDA